MGNNEAETPSKSDKISSTLQEQPTVHPYPEWTTMQAYYAPGVGVPPYFSSAVVPGHASHPYLWGPQALMPPFGTPYPAIYSHGGGYSHPSMAIGSRPQGQGNLMPMTNEPVLVTPPSTEPPKASKPRSLMKKLKGFDGLAVSVSNGSSENEGGTANGQSPSEEDATDSSEGTDGCHSQEAHCGQRKRNCSDDTAGKNGKSDLQSSSEGINATKITLGVSLAAHPNITAKAVAIQPLSIASGAEFRVSASGKSKTGAAVIPLSNTATVQGHDSEHWVQDERGLKLERRKQSNRESARRSRLRKQAETEDLAQKVESLVSENMALKTEITQLSEMSQKLRQENAALMEKVDGESTETSGKAEETQEETPPIAVKNLLSRVNNSSSTGISEEQENDGARESSGAKLHQLLDPSPRTDTVAAG